MERWREHTPLLAAGCASATLINSDGSLLHNYRKTHLFGQAEKNNFLSGYTETGNEKLFSVVKVADFPVGILNCYEAEFPELPRILALRSWNEIT